MQADTVLAAVRRFAPGADSVVQLVRLSGGASQETWSIVVGIDGSSQRLILRRAPAREPVSGKISPEDEAAVVRAAQRAGVPSPQVLYVLAPDDGLGRGYVMTHVQGEALGRKIVRDEAFAGVRPTLARRAGEVLARIHAIDLAGLPPVPSLPQTSPAQLIAKLFDDYRRCSAPRPVFELAFRWLSERMPPAHAKPHLVHGDFRNGNLLVTPDGIAAVLDWELVHVGDPMLDLGWLCTGAWRYSVIDKPVGGFGERAELIAGYESAGGARVEPQVLQFWETLGSLRWGVMCVTMGASAGQSDRAVEMAMIARRTSENEIDLLRLLAPRGT